MTSSTPAKPDPSEAQATQAARLGMFRFPLLVALVTLCCYGAQKGFSHLRPAADLPTKVNAAAEDEPETQTAQTPPTEPGRQPAGEPPSSADRPRQVETARLSVEKRPAPAAATDADEPAAKAAGLVLQNPASNGGAVHFLIDDEVFTLQPSRTQRLEGRGWMIRFHRGGDFGNVLYRLSPGQYTFAVTGTGWELSDASGLPLGLKEPE